MIFFNDTENGDVIIEEIRDAWGKQPYKIVRPPNFVNYDPNRDRYVPKERNFDTYHSQYWTAREAAWETINMR